MADGTLRVERVDPRRLHDLRRRILRADHPEASVVDPRDDEDDALHYAGLVGERVVVSASFYPAPSPVHPGATSVQLRYMASDLDVRGHGYGRRVLEVAEADLRARGVSEVWANGRDSALGFYRATGWTVVEGSAHLSPETALPHHVIVKALGVVESDGVG